MKLKTGDIIYIPYHINREDLYYVVRTKQHDLLICTTVHINKDNVCEDVHTEGYFQDELERYFNGIGAKRIKDPNIINMINILCV